MKLNKDWRRFGSYIQTKSGHKFWFHASIPSQSEYVAEFMQSTHGIDLQRMRWRYHMFYIIHGFMLDCVPAEGSIFEQYLADIEHSSLGEALEIHMSHPLLDENTYIEIQEAFAKTRDHSDEAETIDIDSDEDEEKVEKKELA